MLVVTVAQAFSPLAMAFCRSTTDCKSDECKKDKDECPAEGIPIRWSSPSISFSVNQNLSAKYDQQQTRDVIIRSFQAWVNVICPKQNSKGETLCSNNDCKTPLRFKELPNNNAPGRPWPGIACERSEYNQTLANVNAIFFNDNTFVYKDADNTLARTKTYKNSITGDIFDADIEVNTSQIILSVEEDSNKALSQDEDGRPIYDLQSILTHEIGHFLGLAHSQRSDATMFFSYNPNQRDLTDDDIEGICTIYRPGTNDFRDFTPRNGFSGDCPESATSSPVNASCAYAGTDATVMASPWRWSWWGPVAGLLTLGALVRLRSRSLTS